MFVFADLHSQTLVFSVLAILVVMNICVSVAYRWRKESYRMLALDSIMVASSLFKICIVSQTSMKPNLQKKHTHANTFRLRFSLPFLFKGNIEAHGIVMTDPLRLQLTINAFDPRQITRQHCLDPRIATIVM
jgi:hypothetical protein